MATLCVVWVELQSVSAFPYIGVAGGAPALVKTKPGRPIMAPSSGKEDLYSKQQPRP